MTESTRCIKIPPGVDPRGPYEKELNFKRLKLRAETLKAERLAKKEKTKVTITHIKFKEE